MYKYVIIAHMEKKNPSLALCSSSPPPTFYIRRILNTAFPTSFPHILPCLLESGCHSHSNKIALIRATQNQHLGLWSSVPILLHFSAAFDRVNYYLYRSLSSFTFWVPFPFVFPLLTVLLFSLLCWLFRQVT